NLFAQNSSANREKSLILLNQLISGKDHRHDISRRVSLKDSTWQEWQKRTGELPPDFEKMQSRPILASPLSNYQGTNSPVLDKAQWNIQREWIKQQFQQWISGKIPPAPKDFKVNILRESVENGVKDQMIELHFGPQYKAKITFELMIPEGKGPFPVYMTQWTHRHWAQIAVRRGYVGCVYAAADGNDDSQAYQALYPDYDFSGLMRRAWAASRVIDYLITQSYINQLQIAITGHSRNGKQSLWAAAFDKRIQAVISSSSGTGGDTPWIYTEPQFCNQTLDDIYSNASHWFHPRLRFFFGNEDKLPVDQNDLLSLIAPRALLMHYSVLENGMNPWANEQCFYSVRSVYEFLNATNKIGILPRLGEHPVAERDIERCIDFLDIQFGRNKENWKNQLYFNVPMESWMKKNLPLFNKNNLHPIALEKYPEQSDFEKIKPQIQNNINWLLGIRPPKVKANHVVPANAYKVDWMDRIIGRPVVKNCSTVYYGPYEAIGDYQNAMLYLPNSTDPNKKFPVVLFLHQYAYANGSAYGYSDSKNSGNNSSIFQQLIDQGFAVLSIDMLGFGTRLEEGAHFYDRYPSWSKMGKMVEDVSDCVDALCEMDHVDSNRIFIL
ncbi:MAG: alpha/beta hydrolase, partial [Bacteroidota bacterium]|nr:alpha/beta hydrolase [Bacteroidota bacterium]